MSEESKSAASPQEEQKATVEDAPRQNDDIDQFYCRDPNCNNKKKSNFSFPCPICRDEIVYCGACFTRDEARDDMKIPAGLRIARDRTYGHFDFPISMPATGFKCATCEFVIGRDVDEPAAEVARRVMYTSDSHDSTIYRLLIDFIRNAALFILAILIIHFMARMFAYPLVINQRLESVVLGNLYERGVLQIIGRDGDNLLVTDGYSLAAGSVAHSDTRYYNDLALVYPTKVTHEEMFTWWPDNRLFELTVACATAPDATCRNATFSVYLSINNHFVIHAPRAQGARLAYPKESEIANVWYRLAVFLTVYGIGGYWIVLYAGTLILGIVAFVKKVC